VAHTPETPAPATPGSASSTLETIKAGIGDLLHLNVLTVVGDVALTDDHQQLAPASLESVDKLFTRMGLLDGDITTAISPVFVTDEDYAAVRDYHQETVELGLSTVRQNIEALGQLVRLIKDELGET
jgi:hypothetical protein